MNQLRGSVAAARRVHTPQARFESGDRNQTSLTAAKAVLSAQASRLGFSFSGCRSGLYVHDASLNFFASPNHSTALNKVARC